MFDKIGSNNPGIQGSPGPVDFQGSNKMPANYHSLKPMHKMTHNSSFDSMPIHNQLGQLQVQHHQSSKQMHPTSQPQHLRKEAQP